MSHYKRRKPRRQVRCQVCTPHRNGNKVSDVPLGHRPEEPMSEIPVKFGPATRKRRKLKPWLVEYRYVGPKKHHYSQRWLLLLYPREWGRFGSYTSERGARDAVRAHQNQRNSYPWDEAAHWEFRITKKA